MIAFWKKNLCVVLLCFIWSSTYAQNNIKISGYVTEAETGECLIGAVIYSGKDWAVTNDYGFYSLTLGAGDHIISCSYLGMRPVDLSVSVRKDMQLHFTMSPTESLDEAVITARSTPELPSAYMGVIDIPVSYIQEMPAVLGEPDALKTIQKMPGVQPGMAAFSGIYVRGGGAEENLILLDGCPIYNVSHMMGLFSAFTPEAIKQMTLYKGFFPAKYGGRSSSVIDIRTKEGNLNKIGGTVSVGLLNSRLHIEGPVFKDRTSFSLSIRGTNSLPLMPFRLPYSYYFYDITGKLTHRFSNSDRLYLSVFHGNDQFKYNKKDIQPFEYTDDEGRKIIAQETKTEKYDLKWGNTTASIRWNHRFGRSVFSDLAVSWSDYRMREYSFSSDYVGSGEQTGYFQQHTNASTISDLIASWDFEAALSTHQKLSFGLTHTFHAFSPEKDYASRMLDGGEKVAKEVSYASNKNVKLTGGESSAYLEDQFNSKRFNASAGLRATLFTTEGRSYLSLEPRASVELVILPGLSAKAAYSRMSQYVHLLASGMMSLPTDLWVPITADIKPIFSTHYSAGLFYSWGDMWSISLEAYLKEEENVLEYKEGQLVFTSASDWEQSVEMGEAKSKGLELLVQKTAGKLTGMLAYTLSKTDRVFPDGTINAGKPFPFTYDRRHTLDLFVRYKFNDKISASASWCFYSGNMITASWRPTFHIGPAYVENVGETNPEVNFNPYISGRNNFRLPPSHRLDVSVDFRKQKKHGERIWSFGLCNAYGAQNPDWVVLDASVKRDKEGHLGLTYGLEKRSLLIFLPSVSYSYIF